MKDNSREEERKVGRNERTNEGRKTARKKGVKEVIMRDQGIKLGEGRKEGALK